ncbi:uncharacterized protein [Struthio camelus]|uniref:uncharacterized protein isoform X1 n=1 Tax=Struthio camelus TaxID=8801 RepID=UPI0036040420
MKLTHVTPEHMFLDMCLPFEKEKAEKSLWVFGAGERERERPEDAGFATSGSLNQSGRGVKYLFPSQELSFCASLDLPRQLPRHREQLRPHSSHIEDKLFGEEYSKTPRALGTLICALAKSAYPFAGEKGRAIGSLSQKKTLGKKGKRPFSGKTFRFRMWKANARDDSVLHSVRERSEPDRDGEDLRSHVPFWPRNYLCPPDVSPQVKAIPSRHPSKGSRVRPRVKQTGAAAVKGRNGGQTCWIWTRMATFLEADISAEKTKVGSEPRIQRPTALHISLQYPRSPLSMTLLPRKGTSAVVH